MRTVAIASALVVWSAATALAGDAAVSPSTLDSMGLGSMQQMSDSDGRTVRGKGPLEDWFGDRIPTQLGNSIGSIADMLGDGFGGISMGDQIIGGFELFTGGLPFGGGGFNFGGGFDFGGFGL